MNDKHINAICSYFEIGTAIQTPSRVYGGLLHIMWRLDTTKGSYALKQLSKKINLKDNQIIKNYELSEQIAARFAAQGIPAIFSIKQYDKHLFIIDENCYLIYPWVNAKALDHDAVSEYHALKIAQILARMHGINLDEPEIHQPELYTFNQDKLLALFDQAEAFKCPFIIDLRKNQNHLLAANKSYQTAVPILRKQAVITHGDLDQKNVLWDANNNPILIDWESVGKINPTYDIINTAFYWSGITCDFDKELFFKIIDTYQSAGGVINSEHIPAACDGAFSWINWLVYNIECSCVCDDSESKITSIGQVKQTLATILRLQKIIPEIIKIFKMR